MCSPFFLCLRFAVIDGNLLLFRAERRRYLPYTNPLPQEEGAGTVLWSSMGGGL